MLIGLEEIQGLGLHQQGIIRQVKRMRKQLKFQKIVVADFVCPLKNKLIFLNQI